MQNSQAIKDNAFRLVELVTGHAELHLAIAASDSGEAYVAFSPEAMQSLKRLKDDTWQTDAFLRWQGHERGASMLSLATAGNTRNAQPYEIVLTVDLSEDKRLLRKLLITAATAAPFALALVFLSALAIASFGLRPLIRFKWAVAGVSANTLASRLDTAGLPSELQSLGAAFNLMLERLEDSVTRLSQFSGDLAHEMRTPLATLLGRSQVALSQTRSAEQLLDVLEANVEELQRLSRLIADMLFLAQTDQAHNALDLKLFELSDAATQVSEFLDLIAQERGVSIAVQGKALVAADRGLVQRAITNLLTNAIRHCTPGTQVRVIIQTDDGGVSLEVVNQGSAIASEHLERIFDRFYRIDTSRGRDLGGTGLGLAIVKAIMALHGGTVRAQCAVLAEVSFCLYFAHPGKVDP